MFESGKKKVSSAATEHEATWNQVSGGNKHPVPRTRAVRAGQGDGKLSGVGAQQQPLQTVIDEHSEDLIARRTK